MLDTPWLFAFFAASGTLLVTFWSYLKIAFSQLSGYFIESIVVEGEIAEDCLKRYIVTNGKRSKYGKRTFRLLWLWNPNKGVGDTQIIEKLTPGVVYWLDGWKPIWYEGSGKDNDVTDNQPNKTTGTNCKNNDNAITIKYFRGTLHTTELVKELKEGRNIRCRSLAATDNRDFHGQRYRVWRYKGTSQRRNNVNTESSSAFGLTLAADQISSSNLDVVNIDVLQPVDFDPEDYLLKNKISEPLTAVSLPNSANSVLADIAHWYHNKQWYQDRTIPWRRGYVLFGKPGTGKTSTIKALAMQYNMPISLMDLASMDNGELIDSYSTATGNTPCMVVFEDLHAVFDGTKTILGGVSFDCFLNTLDGLDNRDGVLHIITTNEPHKLAESLATFDERGKMQALRYGRVDGFIEFDGLSAAGVEQIAKRILLGFPELVKQVVADCVGMTGAEVQNKCRLLAIQQFHAQQLEKSS